MLFVLAEVTRLLESSSELIRTLEQVNLSLREGKSLDISIRTLEAIAGLKAQLESLLQGRKWRNAVERIWAFGPRRCDTNLNDMAVGHMEDSVHMLSYYHCVAVKHRIILRKHKEGMSP